MRSDLLIKIKTSLRKDESNLLLELQVSGCSSMIELLPALEFLSQMLQYSLIFEISQYPGPIPGITQVYIYWRISSFYHEK